MSFVQGVRVTTGGTYSTDDGAEQEERRKLRRWKMLRGALEQRSQGGWKQQNKVVDRKVR